MTGRFLEYPLDKLLNEGTKFIVDQELQIVSQIRIEESAIIEQQHFPDQEYGVLMVLLRWYPNYAPLEELQSALTGRSVERCRRDINRAFDEGEGDGVMRPIRNVISRLRVKVHAFEIDARSIIETGYLLMPDRTSKYSKRTAQPL